MQGVDERRRILWRATNLLQEMASKMYLADRLRTCAAEEYVRQEGQNLFDDCNRLYKIARNRIELHLINCFDAQGSSFELDMSHYEEEFHCE